MSQLQNSIVRRSVRHDVLIRGAVAVMSEHSGLVRFAAAAGARDGWVDVDLVDFSFSGVGFMSPVYVPRRVLLLVRLMGYGQDSPVIMEAPVRVQRTTMTDRRPVYLVGTAFADPSEQSIEQINRLLELLEGEGNPAGGGVR
jgi:hypothetical protein